MTADESALSFAHALSAAAVPQTAAEQVAAQITVRLGGPPDLLLIFVAGSLAPFTEFICGLTRRLTGARHVIGTTASGVIAGETEIERRPAVSALAAVLPGVDVHPLRPADLSAMHDAGEGASGLLRSRSPLTLAATFVMADPFSVPLTGLLPTLSAAHDHGGEPRAALFGGLASRADRPGGNTLVVDDESVHQGIVGVSLFGEIRCDMAVSQGCRPVGESRVVTRSKGNLVLELGGRPALDVVREIVGSLDESDRRLLAGGLFMGRAVNEHKTRLGRGDYLIRNVVGADEGSSAVAVADIIPPGRTVRLHLRDATTAAEDLELLLDAQQLYDRPAGMVLVTCAGRGERFFGKQNHDAVTVQRAFLPQPPGVEAAKSGKPIDPNARLVPLAGLFAAGEIGPIGRESFVHGFTSCLACFREAGG